MWIDLIFSVTITPSEVASNLSGIHSGGAELSREPVFVVSVIVSLCSVGSALGVKAQATEVHSVASDAGQIYRSDRAASFRITH